MSIRAMAEGRGLERRPGSSRGSGKLSAPEARLARAREGHNECILVKYGSTISLAEETRHGRFRLGSEPIPLGAQRFFSAMQVCTEFNSLCPLVKPNKANPLAQGVLGLNDSKGRLAGEARRAGHLARLQRCLLFARRVQVAYASSDGSSQRDASPGPISLSRASVPRRSRKLPCSEQCDPRLHRGLPGKQSDRNLQHRRSDAIRLIAAPARLPNERKGCRLDSSDSRAREAARSRPTMQLIGMKILRSAQLGAVTAPPSVIEG